MEDKLLADFKESNKQIAEECSDGELLDGSDDDKRAEAAKEQYFKDSDDEENFIVDTSPRSCGIWCLRTCDCLKVVAMIMIINYFWIWTADRRIWEVDVLENMCRRNELNMTFHDDKIVQGQSWSTYNSTMDLTKHKQYRMQIERYHQGAQGHMPVDIQWKDNCKNHTNGTINYSCIKHSTNVWDATFAVARSEIGDKTFLLVIIFTIMWSPWHLGFVYHKEDNSLHKRVHAHNMHMHSHIDLTQINPIKIIIYTSVGQMYVNVKSLLVQDAIYANEVRLCVAIVLCVFLTYYMYDIVKQHLSNMTKIDQQLKKDDDEKYACNKENVFRQLQEEIESKNGMKKKQKKLAEMYTITDYISKPSKTGTKEEQNTAKKTFNNLIKQSMELFNKVDEDDIKRIEKEAEERKQIQRDAKLKWKEAKFNRTTEFKDRFIKQLEDKKAKEKKMFEQKFKQNLMAKGLSTNTVNKIAETEGIIANEKPNDAQAAMGNLMKNFKKPKAEVEMSEVVLDPSKEVNQSMAFQDKKDSDADSFKQIPEDKATDLFKQKFKEKYINDDYDKIVQEALEKSKQKTSKGVDGCKSFVRSIVNFVKKFFFDIFFLLFMFSQEIDDTSFLKQFQYRSRFEISTLVYAVCIGHIAVNLIVVTIAFIFAALFVTQNQAGLFGVTTMYFICVYEFSFHILNWASTYLELGYII